MAPEVIGAVVVASLGWVFLFAPTEADHMWTRTWVVATLLSGYSVASLLSLDRLDATIGPLGVLEAAVGAAVGVAWLVATHVGHAVLARLFPSFGEAVRDLYSRNVAARPVVVGAAITTMAIAEELLFRGVIQGSAGLVAAVAVYATVQVAERNWALVLAAILSGALWGVLFELTGGLVAPMVAHATWTVMLTLVWPLGSRAVTSRNRRAVPGRSTAGTRRTRSAGRASTRTHPAR